MQQPSMYKILVIDDEPSTRELLQLSLESDGYEVYTAEDGIAGLQRFYELEPHIVITDIRMPGMDGIEVLRRIKAHAPGVEVIVVTAHGQMELTIQALQLEASDFINKPISDQAITVALKRACGKIHMRRRLHDADQEIRQRSDFEHRLIQVAMDGVIANNRRGEIIIFNEGASRIYGYTREEALAGLHVAKLYPRGRAQHIKKLIYGPEYGGPGQLINFETEALNKTGQSIPILLSATLLYENDTEVATVGYFKDLTEIKRLQQELVQQARMATMGQAMAEVAHGVKNILYGMKLGAFMVEKGLHNRDLGLAQKGWPMVRKNMERISGLTLDMLSYARKDVQHREVISLNRVVHEVCSEMQGRAAQLGIDLRDELSPGPLDLSADPESLHTCVLNLVGNALEAFPEDAADRRVRVRTLALADGSLAFFVEDNGKGISAELQEEIFKPLFSTKRARGTGLGLAITNKIIQEHGGSIRVRSEPNQGTVFEVRLPSGPVLSL